MLRRLCGLGCAGYVVDFVRIMLNSAQLILSWGLGWAWQKWICLWKNLQDAESIADFVTLMGQKCFVVKFRPIYIDFISFGISGQPNWAPCTSVQSLDIFFRIIDFCNILRGFFFFIIFVCKSSIWEKIRHYWFLKLSSPPQHQDGIEMKGFQTEEFLRRTRPFNMQDTVNTLMHNQGGS